jgi:ABC-type multidrug transport system ATPase subunit
MAGRTTFGIAHRLSTIELADQIVVLEHGRIVAQGDHEELLERSELYREIASGIASTEPPSVIAGERVLAAGAAAEADGGGRL